MNKIEIAREFRSMVEERLFGDSPWSSDDPEVNRATQDKLSALGLQHVDPITGNIHTTDLGSELQVNLMLLFMGHHEPYELPDQLLFRSLITGEESNELTERFDNGERPEEVLPPLLRKLWNKHFAN
jgi:hypothetical protein